MTDKTTKPDISSLRIHRDDMPERDSGHHGRRARAWLWIPSIGVLIVLVILFALQATDQTSAVETAVVQRLSPAAAQSLLTATGYVVAQRKASVASKGTGRLEVLNVEEGDRVQAGDILGELEADDVSAALGFSRLRVLGVFLMESVWLGLLGGLVGLVAASFMSFVQVSTTNWNTFSELAFDFALSPGIVAGILIFSLTMGILGGFLPAVRAARAKIVDSLREA